MKITTWHQFEQTVRARGCNLLRRLGNFPRSILVAGCQRSGTTMLSRIITQSEGMTNYWFGPMMNWMQPLSYLVMSITGHMGATVFKPLLWMNVTESIINRMLIIN
jgi:hypothetical protein